MDILDYKTINLNRIIYSDPTKVKGNCLLTKAMYNYNNSEIPIYIQTPKLSSVNGIVMNDTRSYIELELNKNHINFYDFINSLDEHNIHITYTNSEEWFEQKLPMDVIDDFYNSPIKSKMNSLPTIKFKIPLYKNKKGCDIFSENGTPMDPKNVKKNTDVICILELSGIKYYKHRFECEWNVVQLKAFTNENVVRQCMINEDLLSDNEDDSEYCIEEKKNKSLETETQIIDTQPIQEEKSQPIQEEKSQPVEEEQAVEEVEAVEEEQAVEAVEVEQETQAVEEEQETHTAKEEQVEEGENVEEEENVEDEEPNLELESCEEINLNEDSEDESESEVELEELDDLNDLEEVELEENESRNMSELMEEINELKRKALEKDEEVNNLKNKYKNLYQDLNL